jgi:hypothetical protein
LYAARQLLISERLTPTPKLRQSTRLISKISRAKVKRECLQCNPSGVPAQLSRPRHDQSCELDLRCCIPSPYHQFISPRYMHTFLLLTPLFETPPPQDVHPTHHTPNQSPRILLSPQRKVLYHGPQHRAAPYLNLHHLHRAFNRRGSQTRTLRPPLPPQLHPHLDRDFSRLPLPEKLDTQWYEVNEAGVVVCTETPPRYHEEEDDDGLDEEYYEGDYHGEDYWERRDRLRQTRRLGLEVDRMPFVVRMRLRVRTRTWDARERWRGNRYVGWMRVAVKMLRPRRRGHEDEDAWGLDGWVL